MNKKQRVLLLLGLNFLAQLLAGIYASQKIADILDYQPALYGSLSWFGFPHLYFPFICDPICKFQGVPMLKNEIKEKQCIWCRQPIEIEGRKFFCCDEHEADPPVVSEPLTGEGDEAVGHTGVLERELHGRGDGGNLQRGGHETYSL